MKDILRLLRLFHPYRAWMAAGIALSVVVALSNVALLALSGWFIASMALSGLGNQMFNFFTPAAAIRGLAILRTIARYLERLVTHDATLRLLSALRVWFYGRLEPLAPAGLQSYRDGDLLSRIRADIDSLDNFYLRILAPVVSAAISTVALLAAMSFISMEVALINGLGLLLAGCALPLMAQRSGRRPGARLVTTRAALRASVTDSCRGAGELRVYGAVDRQGAHIDALGRALVADQRHLVRVRGSYSSLSMLAALISMWIAVIVIIPVIHAGVLAPAQLALVAFFVLSSFDVVASLPAAFQSLGETLAAARRIFEIADAEPVALDPDEQQPLPERFDIDMDALQMHYSPVAAWALDGISLHVPEGDALGIVGPSGSGKSSLLNVLLRFWDFQDGKAAIGGVPLRALTGEQVRSLCAVVAQQSHLFNATIRENLLLARPSASEEELREALRQAAVLDEVMAFPQGLDTYVGEVGARLSGGQARRITIARAFLKNAPILLLDEPTEGLDELSEQLVLNALKRLMRDKTTLVITHHPEVLTLVDRVVVLRAGRIVPSYVGAEELIAEGVCR
ncbi:thiol reductant ABC exporter subunit CydC [Rhizobiaceae bacterium n13]|uniref:Thiol reductant ABC exporter subunit CydC n=1 Tax=Ferirhizobium litorale TaxID=2927786 RepID=A0AAE3QEM3_9HYPH|nr:thiol reductant ABC exporter subunit CydC [Fererhizobium litorale]MDI7862744.1 thiol reductant ABC exporter subunit CydC [Fererhizobium litorale]MDI7924392.1 thiol reductant ABC exporter subunit CydC [Fererhizobium litorale]